MVWRPVMLRVLHRVSAVQLLHELVTKDRGNGRLGISRARELRMNARDHPLMSGGGGYPMAAGTGGGGGGVRVENGVIVRGGGGQQNSRNASRVGPLTPSAPPAA